MFSCVLKVCRVPTCCNYLCSSKWCSVILFPRCLPLFTVPAFLLALTSVSFQSFWAIEATRPRCNMPKASKTRKNIRCFATIDSDTSIYQYIPVTFKTTKNDENMCRDMSRAWRSFSRIPSVAFAGTGTGSPRSPVIGDDGCRRCRRCSPAANMNKRYSV